MGSARTDHACRLLTCHRVRAIKHHDEGQSMGMNRTAEIKGKQSLYRKVQRLVFTPPFHIRLMRINRTYLTDGLTVSKIKMSYISFRKNAALSVF